MNSVAIIGYGNQARAWALNLKDSKVNFSIGLRKDSQSNSLAQKKGFKVFNFQEKSNFDYYILLTPDSTHFEIVQIINKLNPKAKFIYAHGFSLVSKDIHDIFNCSHLLLAPKSIASELRFEYEMQGKIPAIYSLEYSKEAEKDKEFLFNLAKDVGITCLKEASFAEETKADLLSEQSILCSALPYIAHHSFEVLRENGVPKELAYFECFHELKSIANTLVKLGPLEFFKLISPNALVGSQIGAQKIYNQELKEKIKNLYLDIESKKFEKSLTELDLNVLKERTIKFWQKSELSKTHKELRDELY